MKQKIYWNMCLTALLSILFSAVLVSFIYYGNLERQMKKEIATEAKYIDTAIDLSGEDYLNSLQKKIMGSENNRITLIDQDGTVLFDNYADIAGMGNHSDRPEVQQALKGGSGQANRTSSTLSEQTYYYAVKLTDGNVLRVAGTTRSVLASMMYLIPWLVVMSAVLLSTAMIVANIQTEKIVEPINTIDIDHPDRDKVYDELSPLVRRIEKQNQTICDQMEILKQKQTEFTTITSNMSEGFIVVDAKADVISYNISAMRLLGIDKAVSGEINISVLNFNRSSSFREAVDEALSGRHSEQELNLYGHYYQLIANPVLDGTNIKGAIIVIMDVTEKKGRDDMRREFSANVSHELKTPLTSISGYAEIMKNGMVKPEDMPRFAGNIYQEAQRLITLVEDIIKLSQLDEEKVELDKSQVDLFDIAADVAKRLKTRALEQKIAIELKGKPAVITGTRQILDEMIFNLTDNAIKYNKKDGKVVISVEPEADGHATVFVEDTGIGIPEADQGRVFERFYRVDKSHSKQIGGTGLGLSIVKHGAQYHGASVEMNSREGKGTKVSIHF